MVVVSIMVLITAVILVQQARFDSSTLLRSLAYSVALSVRQAQIYGSSVLGTTASTCTGGNLSSGTCYASAYGVHFTSNATSYTLFADLNNDGRYEPGVDAIVQTFAFNNGYELADACATWISNPSQQSCFVAQGLTSFDIVFHRPNPEACFSSSAQTAACAQPGVSDYYSQVKLSLENTSDPTNTRSVIVTQTGEISVCALSGC